MNRLLNDFIKKIATEKSLQKSLPMRFVGLAGISKLGQFCIPTDANEERYLAPAGNKRI